MNFSMAAKSHARLIHAAGLGALACPANSQCVIRQTGSYCSLATFWLGFGSLPRLLTLLLRCANGLVSHAVSSPHKRYDLLGRGRTSDSEEPWWHAHLLLQPLLHLRRRLQSRLLRARQASMPYLLGSSQTPRTAADDSEKLLRLRPPGPLGLEAIGRKA